MTSSLVGSEMCIRDSATCAPPRQSLGRRAFRARTVGRRHAPHAGGEGACLLYTSDAADDM
eukprot:7153743-Prorocentrum_lima.AAC.1